LHQRAVMLTTGDVIEHWARHGRGTLATKVRRAATSALGTYGAYLGYGLFHGKLRKPFAGAEATAPLPGDALVEWPDSTKTFVRDICAPPDAVWPYLVQMGFGRAGWYGWYPMENGGRGSLPGVIGLWQELAVGDVIPDGLRAGEGLGAWRVVELEPSRSLVLLSSTAECSWAFVLRPIAGGGCRLIVRVRARFLGADASGLAGRVMRRFFDVGDTVMEWTMLDGIKHRAERNLAASRVPPRD
jgi:hypothetical protein